MNLDNSVQQQPRPWWSQIGPPGDSPPPSPPPMVNLNQRPTFMPPLFFSPCGNSIPTPPRRSQQLPRFEQNNNNRIQFSRSLRSAADDTDEEYEEILSLINYTRNRNPTKVYTPPRQEQPPWDGVQVPLDVSRVWTSLITDIQEEFTYLFAPWRTDEMKPYTEKDVRRTAIFSRLILILIQMFACLTLPRHENDGFKTPGNGPGVEETVLDRMANVTLGGLVNWDGQYFLHVATHGYTHENTMAFFPLFPMTIGIIASLLHSLLLFPFLSIHSLAVVIGVGFNIWCFQNTAVALSKLLQLQLGKNVALAESLLPSVVYLFCYNPASIFFSAFYSETLFAWMTFSCILELYQRNFERAIGYASFSSICRSNGLLNFGLIAIAAFGDIVSKASPEVSYAHRPYHFQRYTDALKKIVKIGIMCLIGLIPFATFQVYCAKEFCGGDRAGPLPAFCFYDGLPYTYIQQANWNVGFLQYFELKQIPNFILAVPVLLTLGLGARRHAKSHRIALMELREAVYENILELTLAWHGLFLTVFCLFFVHVQVSTRMIMSACPYIYIYIVKTLTEERSLFLSRIITSMPYTSFINVWFGMYFLVGTIGFSLGYPWT